MLTRARGLVFTLLSTACTVSTPPEPPPMTTPSNDPPTQTTTPELVGETVTLSVVGEFRVGHGRFRLGNPGSEPVHAKVEGLWFEVDGQRTPLVLGSVHDLQLGINLDPLDIELAPGQTLTVLIGFPPFVHEPHAQESSAVVVSVAIDGRALEASSALRFERRLLPR